MIEIRSQEQQCQLPVSQPSNRPSKQSTTIILTECREKEMKKNIVWKRNTNGKNNNNNKSHHAVSRIFRFSYIRMMCTHTPLPLCVCVCACVSVLYICMRCMVHVVAWRSNSFSLLCKCSGMFCENFYK